MKANYEVHSLSVLLSDKKAEELFEQRLKEFRCSRDPQLERFIHEQAIVYEKKGFGRTYLVFDTSSIYENEVEPIAAFFTLTITATDYSEISRNKKAKVLGSKPGRETFGAFGGILIGQLARDDRYGPDFIDTQRLSPSSGNQHPSPPFAPPAVRDTHARHREQGLVPIAE